MGGIGIAVIALRNQENAPTNDNLVESGRGWPMYRGSSIDDWQVLGGSWSQSVDQEGGNVMSGCSTELQSAIHARTLPLPAESPPSSFRIRVGIDVLDARAVEIRFGASADSDDPGGATLSLRLVDHEVILGRAGKSQGFEPLSTPRPLSPQRENMPHYYRVQLDYHDHVWRAKVDDTFVATAPAATGVRQDRLTLIVVGGSANFESVWLVELAEASPAS
jgi:hypothetical protein